MNDMISRQAAIDAVAEELKHTFVEYRDVAEKMLNKVPSAQPEHLTDEDFETIRIHLNAYKEQLCNQHRWEEAEDYQRIIDRFMAFASAQPEDYTELKREFLRMASYIDALLECSDEQKETLIGFISRISEYMPWTETD